MPNLNYRVWISVLVVVLAATTSVNAATADPYADFVVSFAPGPRPGVDPKQDDPDATLGARDYDNVTKIGCYVLGNGGVITLQFTDNYLTGSGDATADLFIYEVGPDLEGIHVEISETGLVGDWISVGKAENQIPELDIDPYIADWKDRFYFVRLTDSTDPADGETRPGPWTGADIDAIQALSSGDAGEIPEPLTMISVFMGLAVAGRFARRRRRA